MVTDLTTGALEGVRVSRASDRNTRWQSGLRCA